MLPPGLCTASGASAADYRTPEYLAGRGLDAVHAAEAYAQGYSGKGVTVGVLDSNALPQHFEFFEKIPYPVEYFITPQADDWHGVHTAGTIAASRNNAGMHGVAYDADLVSMVGIGGIPPYEPGETYAEAISAFRAYPNVSIISNSWGFDLTLADWPGVRSSPADHVVTVAGAMAPPATNSGTLFIFAAGNDGYASPSTPAALPALMTGTSVIGKTITPASQFTELTDAEKCALSLNMLSVSAFDPGRATDRLDFVAPFSNLADGSAHFSLLAPGVDIYSSVGPGADDYWLASGTSMATPHVAGAAALVKEAFPWMNGKQIADTLLSTAAHPAGMDGLPPFLIQTCQMNGERIRFSVTAPRSVSSADLAGHEEEIRRLWETSGRSQHETLEDFTARLTAAMDGESNNNPNVQYRNGAIWIPKHIITPVQYTALFGMGVVNAGEAVRGPGYLDANRLSDGDKAEYAGAYAMYGVDTGGYDSVWLHDIGQVKVLQNGAYPNGVATPAPNGFNSSLADLDVGLRKQGGGTLTLTGDNGWLGPTVIEGGGITLGRTGQPDGAARLAGDVRIERGAAFGGNGLVGGDLLSEGLLIPGLIESPGSILTVQGDVTSRGAVRLVLEKRRANLLLVNGAADIAGTVIEFPFGMKGGAMPASVYDVIRAASLSGVPANNSARIQQGVTLIHSFDLRTGAGVLRAVRAGSAVMPQTKALSEGFLSGAALVNLGADLVAGQATDEAVKAARAAREGVFPGIGLAAFGALSGGRQRYNSGSHVDMGSLSLLAGLSLGADLAPGRLTLGAFFEYGNGSYDTYNNFSNVASVHGDGDIYHIGGGILGRMDFINTGPGRVYAEASGRAGGVHNEYGSSDLRDASNRTAEYDTTSAYYGFHLGTGYVWNITESASLDLYGKYFWTRQEGAGVTLSTGDPVKFKDTDSSRLRFGGRFALAVNEYVSPYIGAAWEYEFTGKARATTNGYDIDAPSLRGDTGIGELGLTFKPSQSLPLSFDFGVQGYVGKREGVTGNLQARLEF